MAFSFRLFARTFAQLVFRCDSSTAQANGLVKRRLCCILLAVICVGDRAAPDAYSQETKVKPPEPQMDSLWGDKTAQLNAEDGSPAQLFRDGNYAMFIHWGLYSNLAGRWKGDTYYGICEWLMHKNMARIPAVEYKETTKTFNPVDFDAQAIVGLAKAAGMKYIVITSKHHDGFAMFDSDHPFNIVDTTPFARDPMKELAEACREAGLGFGFYYSHRQDWTAPGGGGGPGRNADGSKASFDQYFKEKCYPQVKEICTRYGPLAIVWFDTPGKMPKEHVIALRDLVRETQPKALLCSRIGHGMGDYVSHGDMEVPPENIEGMWETVDTTNDSWSFAWYDTNWKGPREILRRLISTVARGGTYMLNVGPDGSGVIPERCQLFLKQAGAWVERHPSVIYNAGPSPWQHELAWGDATLSDKQTINLCIYDWPQDGQLYLPGLISEIKSAVLVKENQEIALKFDRQPGIWTHFELPPQAADSLVSVIRLQLNEPPVVDTTLGVQSEGVTKLKAHFAEVENAEKKRVSWMEKYGEWKHKTQVFKWEENGTATWTVNVREPGFYQLALSYRGEDRLVWKIETDEGELIQNQQAATTQYDEYPMGILEFKTPGKHRLSVSLVDGNRETSSLASIHLKPID